MNQLNFMEVLLFAQQKSDAYAKVQKVFGIVILVVLVIISIYKIFKKPD